MLILTARTPWMQRPYGDVEIRHDSPLARGLIGAWPVLPTDGTVLRDIVGNNHATAASVFRATSVNGEVIYAPNAVSGNGYALANAPTLTGAASISCWTQSDSITANGAPFAFGGNGTTHYTFGGLGYFQTFRASRVDGVTLPVDITAWHHLCITTDSADRWRLYQNGQLVTDVAPEGSVTLSATVRLGNGSDDGTYSYWGSAYGFLLHNRALSAAEVWALYSPSTRGSIYQPLIRRVYFDIGSGGGGGSRRICAGIVG